MRVRRIPAVVGVVLLGVVACGDEPSPPPDPAPTTGARASPAPAPADPTDPGAGPLAGRSGAQVLAASRAAAVQAGSVHVSGVLATASSGIAVDLRTVDRPGARGGRGTIGEGAESVSVVDDGTSLFLRADRAFWIDVGGAVAADRLADRWLLVPPDRVAAFDQFRTFTDLRGFVDQVLGPPRPLRNLGSRVVDGRPVVVLADDGGQAEPAAEVQLLVADDPAAPLPVRVGPPGSGVVLDEWGGPVDLPPPAGAVDLSTAAEPPSGAAAEPPSGEAAEPPSG